MAWLLSREERRIRSIVNDVCGFVITCLKDKGLVSLYVAGTILTKDRNAHSDIDIFGLVDESYDFRMDDALNRMFEVVKDDLCKGIATRFHAIPVESLNGGKQEGVVAYFTPERIIKRFPFFTQVWGQTFDFSKDFSVKPLALKEEALLIMSQISNGIVELRSRTEKRKYKNFPKMIIELARIEAEHDKGFKFNPSYIELGSTMKDEPGHIVHKALELRSKDPGREDVMAFTSDAQKYVEEMRERVRQWT